MARINLVEKNELALSISAMRYKENVEEEIERKKGEKVGNSNETAKREMAIELMQQGFSEAAICRILNISPDGLEEQQLL